MFAARLAFSIAVLCIPFTQALGHGGGLDAEGCHTNRKTGEYHCHNKTTSSRSAPPAESPAVTYTPSGKSSQKALPPGCYMGPRGGTYTLTKSGKKNYSGC